jgi:hypothetical protein
MPTNIHGSRTSVVVDGFNLSPFLNRASIDKMKTLIDTTVFQPDTTAPTKSRIAAEGDGKIGIGGFWDGTVTTGIDARAEAQLDGGQVAMTLGVNGTAIGTGNRAYLAMLRQSTYKTDSSLGTAVFFSLDAQTDGTGIRAGYFLHGLTSEAAAFAGTTVDWGVSSTSSNGFIANLHVTALTGTPNLAAKLQDSTDGSTWVDVTGGAFATANTVAGQQIRGTASLRRYVRVVTTQAEPQLQHTK